MVTIDPDATVPMPPPAKQRILDTAMGLFYGEGIRTVGIDRIIAESHVTKATFYKHYGAKDTLILAYVDRQRAATRRRMRDLIAANPRPADALRAVLASFADDIRAPRFRGSSFLNAATEFPDRSHPVRVLVTEHREWCTQLFTDLLREAGHPVPGDAADEVLLALDGAMTGGYSGDPVAATSALARATDRLLAQLPR